MKQINSTEKKCKIPGKGDTVFQIRDNVQPFFTSSINLEKPEVV